MTEDPSPDPARGEETPGADPSRGRERVAETGIDAAPEGASEPGRPDADERAGADTEQRREDERAADEESALRDESATTDPHPEQPDPESGAAADEP